MFGRIAYSDWAEQQGLDKRDTGIDLVAKTSGSGQARSGACVERQKNLQRLYRIQLIFGSIFGS
jgi:hypothetical protein